MKNYLKNITTSEDVKYAQSYGSAKEFKYFAGYEENGWLYIYASNGSFDSKKMINAKHFHSFKGVSISERSFKMLIKKATTKRDAEVASYKKEQEKITALAIEAAKLAKQTIIEALTPDRLEKWQKNEGNSHMRRTRWSNRCERIGIDRGYGSLLKDTFFEVLNKNGNFFVDGKYNENHG